MISSGLIGDLSSKRCGENNVDDIKRAHKFEILCDRLPAGCHWGDRITPQMVEEIVLAEREVCAKICDAAQPPLERFDVQRAAGQTARDCAKDIRVAPWHDL